jgi:Tol biopolymer transport system component
VAFQAPDPETGNRDVWYIEVARGITSRLTTHVANDWFPVWSPDGRQILFSSDRDGGAEGVPYMKTSMDPGTGESRLAMLNATPYDWSADAKWISFSSRDLFIASTSGSVQPFPFLATPAWESNPRFSADSRWIAYNSDESGRNEIYVRPFPGQPAAPAGKVQVSNNGGEYAVWGPSDQEIFYMSGDGSIFAVDTRNLGRSETLPPPMRLFQACPETRPLGLPLRGEPYRYSFDTRDGQRFLVNCPVDRSGQFTVLMNWTFPN